MDASMCRQVSASDLESQSPSTVDSARQGQKTDSEYFDSLISSRGGSSSSRMKSITDSESDMTQISQGGIFLGDIFDTLNISEVMFNDVGYGELNPVDSDSSLGEGFIARQVLSGDDSLSSANGEYSLQISKNGDVVISNSQGEPTWSLSGGGESETSLKLWKDGNLVLRDKQDALVWASHTVGSGADSFQVSDDGALVLKRGDGVVWSSHDAMGRRADTERRTGVGF